jgi:hypothetical protein
MKIDAITVAALAVAGLAVAAFGRTRPNGQASANTGQVFGMATQQRQASGSAIPQNTAYLEFWDSPMSNTLYSTGSLGD